MRIVIMKEQGVDYFLALSVFVPRKKLNLFGICTSKIEYSSLVSHPDKALL